MNTVCQLRKRTLLHMLMLTLFPKMSFLHMMTGLSLWDRVRNSDISGELGIELLLLCFKRSQLRWIKRLIRMPPGRFPLEVFWAQTTGRRLCRGPRSHWRDYMSRLAREHLRTSQEELESVAGETDVWDTVPTLACWLRNLTPDKQ